jgi:hypothetical protein
MIERLLVLKATFSFASFFDNRYFHQTKVRLGRFLHVTEFTAAHNGFVAVHVRFPVGLDGLVSASTQSVRLHSIDVGS